MLPAGGPAFAPSAVMPFPLRRGKLSLVASLCSRTAPPYDLELPVRKDGDLRIAVWRRVYAVMSTPYRYTGSLTGVRQNDTSSRCGKAHRCADFGRSTAPRGEAPSPHAPQRCGTRPLARNLREVECRLSANVSGIRSTAVRDERSRPAACTPQPRRHAFLTAQMVNL